MGIYNLFLKQLSAPPAEPIPNNNKKTKQLLNSIHLTYRMEVPRALLIISYPYWISLNSIFQENGFEVWSSANYLYDLEQVTWPPWGLVWPLRATCRKQSKSQHGSPGLPQASITALLSLLSSALCSEPTVVVCPSQNGTCPLLSHIQVIWYQSVFQFISIFLGGRVPLQLPECLVQGIKHS